MNDKITGLGFVQLHVPDIAEATAFYTEKIGFEVEDTGPGFVQFKQGPVGAIFALDETKGASPHSGVELWWTVLDADAVYAQFVERGVKIVSPPKDEPFGRAFSIKDPANNTINLFQLPTGN